MPERTSIPLGCTLYFLLTGRPPFAEPDHDTRLKKVMAHVREQPTPIGRLRPDLSATVIDLLERMLAKNPGDRPRSAAEVVGMLAPVTIGHDLPTLVRARPAPETTEDSSLEGELFDTVPPVPLTHAPAPPVSLVRRAWPVLFFAAVVVTVLAWKFWPHGVGVDLAPPAASKEQGPSPVPAMVTATNTNAPAPATPATGQLFFKGTPEGVVLRITGGSGVPTLVDMDKRRSISLAPGAYRIEIERETTPHTVLQDRVTLENGQSADVVVSPSVAAATKPMFDSWKKTQSDFEKIVEQTEAIQRQQAEENRRAETHKPNPTSP